MLKISIPMPQTCDVFASGSHNRVRYLVLTYA